MVFHGLMFPTELLFQETCLGLHWFIIKNIAVKQMLNDNTSGLPVAVREIINISANDTWHFSTSSNNNGHLKPMSSWVRGPRYAGSTNCMLVIYAPDFDIIAGIDTLTTTLHINWPCHPTHICLNCTKFILLSNLYSICCFICAIKHNTLCIYRCNYTTAASSRDNIHITQRQLVVPALW